MTPHMAVLITGYKRPLMLDDISTYPERMQAKAHAQRFKTAWESLVSTSIHVNYNVVWPL